MPWCPKCKNEYREGITVCADCGVELVDELSEEDSDNTPKPVKILSTDDEIVGKKIVRYLRLNGVFSAVMTEEKKEGEEDGGYDIIVADLEMNEVDECLPGFIEGEDIDEERLYELVPDIEDQFDDIEEEFASKEFSELRSSASTVYVKKKDKYADLKFSGYSFIGFGLLGVVILLLNICDVIHIFNTYSMIVMALVFVVFFAIGIASLIRASKVKNAVNVEDEFTEQLNYWTNEHLTDDVIDEWYDENREDQENYFEITAKMNDMIREEFPNINPAYIEEIADDRYTAYLERSCYEDPDDIPEVLEEEPVKEEGFEDEKKEDE